MPPIPNAIQTVRDGALGIVNTDADKRNVKMGVSSIGTVNTLYEFADPKVVQDTLGYGPLPEAICHALAQPNAGTVLALRVTASTPGASGAVTKIGTGTAVMTLSVGVAYDNFEGVVEILSAAASLVAATATFRYSLDGGDVWSAAIAVPVAGVYAIPNSGLTLTFAEGTFVLGDKYSWTSTGPGFSSGDINAAYTALLADPREWGFVHIVGSAATVAGAIAFAATVDTNMAMAEAQFKYGFSIVELPTDTDANIVAAVAPFASKRISLASDNEELTSSLSGRIFKRHAAWPYAARLGSTTVQRHPGCLQDGSLPGVARLYRDENVTPALDAARITTLRTFQGLAGFYVTNGKIAAPAGSDFGDVMNRRVMDKACRLTRARILRWLNLDLKVDRVTGYLTKDEVAAIESDMTQYLRAGMKAGQDEGSECSDIYYVVTPYNNILSNKTLYGKVRILPKAYSQFIDTELGFVNPALSLAAA